MKKIILTLSFLVVAFIGSSQTIERQVVASGGETYSGSNYIVSSTIGEPITGTATSSTYILSQGFQQGTFTASSLDEKVSVNYKIYPNPVTSILNIELSTVKQTSLHINIYDMRGALVSTQSVDFSGETIANSDFSTLPAGTYVVKISDNANNVVQSLQVVKQ